MNEGWWISDGAVRLPKNRNEDRPLTAKDVRELLDWPAKMGDDGTGHCKGCGKDLGTIDPSCPVCLAALEELS